MMNYIFFSLSIFFPTQLTIALFKGHKGLFIVLSTNSHRASLLGTVYFKAPARSFYTKDFCRFISSFFVARLFSITFFMVQLIYDDFFKFYYNKHCEQYS